MKFAFRVDSSVQIGAGHVQRCLVLARALRRRGHCAIFVCRHLQGDLVNVIDQNEFKVKNLALSSAKQSIEDDLRQTLEIVDAEGGVDWIVLDSYELNYRWEQGARQSGARILVIDDRTTRIHDCDILLDQSELDASVARYRSLLPESCRLCLGPEWFLLREEFCRYDDFVSRNKANEVRRVLIGFGGADPQNETESALRVARSVLPESVEITIVVGPQNQHAERLKSLTKEMQNTVCVIDPPNLAELMFDADLAIGTAGLMALERVFMRLPSLVKAVAENHIAMLEDLESRGYAKVYGNELELGESLALANDHLGFPEEPLVKNGTEALCELLENYG